MKPVLKHTGIFTPTSQRVVVIMRKLQDDPLYALVVEYDRLSEMYRENLFTVLKSDQAAKTNDFYTVLDNRSFGDGQPILTALHRGGHIKKVLITQVTLSLPDNQVLNLKDFNDYMDGIETTQEAEITEIMVSPEPELKGKALAKQLLAEAKALDKQADEKKEKAYVICPELRPTRGRPENTIDEKRAKRMERNRIRRERYAEAKAQQA